jgi:3-oxoacyl-[acyl-carrier-protein] synthase II
MSSNAYSRRAVVTGIGWITPLGDEIEKVWSRLLKGESGVAKTDLFDATTFPTQFSAQVQGFKLESIMGDRAERHREGSRNTQFALGAAARAWTDAGLDDCPSLKPDRVGIYLGGGEGPTDFDPFAACTIQAWDEEKNAIDMPKWAALAADCLSGLREFEQEPNLSAGHLATEFGAQGPCFNTLTACAASTQAIGEASWLVRRGDADVVISGGTHSMIHTMGVTGFNRLTALSTRNDSCLTASRPFDRTRDGFVLGEGAGIVILEEYEHAKSRGASILGEIVGYGSTADAFRITDIHEDGRGAMAAMRLALKHARLSPQNIDYISAHGTGTEENDKIESLAIRGVFGEKAKDVPISSIKSMMGHLIAAAGVVEFITCLLAIRDGVIPPTINYSEPDPNCDLDYVPNEARKAEIKTALSNSFGFGGQNDTLIVTAMNDSD